MCSSMIDDARRGPRVLLGEEPPLEQRNAHGAEVVAADDADVGVDELLALGRRAPFDGDRSPRHHPAERQRRHAAGGRHARQARQPLPELLVGLAGPPRASLYLRPVIVSSSVRTFAGLKPGETFCRRAKLRISRPAADERASPRAPAPRPRAVRRRFRPRPQTALVPAGSPARHLSGCREDRAATAEAPGASPNRTPDTIETASVNSRTRAIDRDLVQPRHARPRPARGCRRGTPNGERPGRARRRRPPSTTLSVRSCRTMRAPARAERRSHGDLLLARQRSRQQQVRDVRAGDQQHESHRRHEHEQRQPHAADRLLLQRQHAKRQAAVRRIEVRVLAPETGGERVELGPRLLDRRARRRASR